MRVFAVALCTAAVLLVSAASAQTLRVATWNVAGGRQSPAELEANARAAAADLGPLDVVTIQEIVDEDQVAGIARGFGLEHWAVSDFSPPMSITNAWFASLEVAVISRTPIAFAGEWDLTGSEPNGDGFPPRVSNEAIETAELPIAVAIDGNTPTRGFLRADLANGFALYAVHWKSSRGESCNAADLANAAQREVQAAGLVQDLAPVLAEDRTAIIAGDFNIQAPGVARVGVDPSTDCAPTGSCDGVCGAGGLDGYDDSIALLLEADATARLLSADLGATFLARFFPGGAIDHIAVVGPQAAAFTAATTPDAGTSYFGSDHRPVVATFAP